jgi:uncharacterized protein
LVTELSPLLVQHILDRLQSELPAYLTYHNAAHTAYVLGSAHFLAQEENLSDAEHALLSVAALYHDAGFLKGMDKHEDRSCEIARAELPAFGYKPDEIDIICAMIQATKLPQTPHTRAECIMADADLLYLGTDKYIEYSEKLYAELKYLKPSINRAEWFDIQVDFLTAHRFHTRYGFEILEPVKQANLHFLREANSK